MDSRQVPKRTTAGEFTDLEVEGEELTVNGAVYGARVCTDACLTVNGVLKGRIVVDPGGVLYVNSTLDPAGLENEGIVFVAGLLSASLDDLDGLGRICLSPGSVIDDNLKLEADGSLTRLVGSSHKINLDTETWCAWVDGEFVPAEELRRRNEEAQTP